MHYTFVWKVKLWLATRLHKLHFSIQDDVINATLVDLPSLLLAAIEGDNVHFGISALSGSVEIVIKELSANCLSFKMKVMGPDRLQQSSPSSSSHRLSSSLPTGI